MEPITVERVYSRLAMDYRHSSITPQDECEKIILILKRLLKFNTEPGLNVINLLEETVRMISSYLEINEVSILILDQKDKKYRYLVFYGLTKKVIQAHKEIEYTYDEVIEYEKKNMKKVSDTTYICFAEKWPKEEIKFFNLHIGKKRAAEDDYVEGDFLDSHIYGSNGQLLGYIEYTGTKKNKMPSAKTILTIELMASIIGALLTNTFAR